MPRETIKHIEEKGAPGGGSDTRLDVRWHRDGGWVQLAVLRAGLEEVFTDPLSRHEINSLIRTLRRARDAAHGADA